MARSIPTVRNLAEDVAKAVYEGWISRFGCPATITTDQGRQFESRVFASLSRLFGIEKTRTTPYHAQCNGIIERWHRFLKAALKARLQTARSWIDELPTVLLGVRAAMRSDTGVSAAQLTYGCNVRLPGDFLSPNRDDVTLDSAYVDQLRDSIRNLRPMPKQPHSNTKPIFVHRDLQTCEYVYVRIDAVKKPLQAPYDGPYRVLKRDSKIFTLQLPNRQTNISIDRLKPAYTIAEQDIPTATTPTICNKQNTSSTSEKQTTKLTNDLQQQNQNLQQQNQNLQQQNPGNDNPTPTTTASRTTRRGRTIRLPKNSCFVFLVKDHRSISIFIFKLEESSSSYSGERRHAALEVHRSYDDVFTPRRSRAEKDEGNALRTVQKDERKYYETLVHSSIQRLMLYPYHLADMIVKVPVQEIRSIGFPQYGEVFYNFGLRITPFIYYVEVVALLIELEKSYDTMPNFTAADCLRLLGIGRNEYLELVAKSRSLGRRGRAKAIRGLLPRVPLNIPMQPWWRVELGYVLEADVKPLSEPEKALIDLLIDRGSQTAGTLDYNVVKTLYR
ncbi:hypothetical protein MSG28_008827 [Choristoneura fumiferana]|uniref:Uncharacterized protein n=1 Tax=Choristoneura fumiferana TaxID=7141 RepID=A0ACC0J899_CHOFU|nr:hypothetical protein MSG28_008827 [Choristoneura fumiferana]